MDKWGIDVAMTGAQKAFAAPPGISPICVNARSKKIHDCKSTYIQCTSIYQDTSSIMMNQNIHHLLLHYHYYMHTEKQ